MADPAPVRSSVLPSLARAAAVASAVFLAAVGLLLAVSSAQIRRADPFNDPAFKKMLAEAAQHPENPGIVESARRLDQLARQAYFADLELQRRGGWMLLAGAVLLLVCVIYLRSVRPAKPAMPSADSPPAWRSADTLAYAVSAAAGIGIVMLVLPRADPPVAPDGVPGLAGPSAGAAATATNAATAGPSPEEWAANWPGLRGPDGLAVAQRGGAPVKWDATNGVGIKWKTKVPRPGFSSPVAWSNRVFVTGADADNREVYAFDADTGAILWTGRVEKTAGSPAKPPEVGEDTGYAASTPVTDGSRVYAIFATGDMGAFDFDGKPAWIKNVGVPETSYGFGSSLLWVNGKLVIQYDLREKDQRVFALNAADGSKAWEIPRKVDSSWASPVTGRLNGKAVVFLNSNPFVTALDPETGKVLWEIDCMGGEVAPSPAFAAGRVIACVQYGKMVAVDAATGKVLWENEEDLPDVSSPVATADLVFTADSGAVVACRDAATGSILWRQEYRAGYYSSPVLIDELVYMADQDGLVRVVKASKTYDLIAENPMGEKVFATPASVGRRLFIRGIDHLFCIESTP